MEDGRHVLSLTVTRSQQNIPNARRSRDFHMLKYAMWNRRLGLAPKLLWGVTETRKRRWRRTLGCKRAVKRSS